MFDSMEDLYTHMELSNKHKKKINIKKNLYFMNIGLDVAKVTRDLSRTKGINSDRDMETKFKILNSSLLPYYTRFLKNF